MNRPDIEICQNCRVGAVRPRPTTYAAWHMPPVESGAPGNVFIVMPDVTAWVCPLCGACSFEPDLLARLAALVGPPVRALRNENTPNSRRQQIVSERESDAPPRRMQ